MSFMKTLINVGIGFAAAKGMEKYSKMGGMAGMKAKMGQSGASSDPMKMMSDMMGGGAGGQAIKDMMGKFGIPSNSQSGMAGLSGLMSAFQGAAATGGGSMADMFSSLTEGTAAGQIAEDNAKLMIRAMIMAAKADGEIDAEEQATIMGHLKDADPEEIAFVKEQLAAPLDPMALARDANEQTRAQVYATSLMAITVDNHAEVKYLDALASALRLDDTTRAQIHRQMGVNQG